jgi:hypothetical protein
MRVFKTYVIEIRLRYILLFFFFLGAIIFFAVRALIVHSDAYGEALYFSCTNLEIAHRAGKISTVKFPFLGEARINESNGDGDAYISLELEAEKGNIVVDIYLKRKEGLWHATGADIEEGNISISPNSLNGETCNCDDHYCRRGSKRRSNRMK